MTIEPSNVSEGLERLAEKYVLEVNEYDDRTSPEDWPEALLITSDELHDLLKRFAAETATLSPPLPSPGVERLREALEQLADDAEAQHCQHETTHRGGAIWTICDGCGAKWADDEGGFKPYETPAYIVRARAALSALPLDGG